MKDLLSLNCEENKENPNDNIENHLIVYKYDEITNFGRSYVILERLGIGTFGQVFKCKYNEKEYAIKIIKNKKIYMKYGVHEADVLNKITNKPHFVQIIDTFIYKQHFCIVMELLGMNLYELLKKREFSGFSHFGMRIILNQLLEALCELYILGIVHCDIKPENVVIYDPESLKIKIIDFGSSFIGQNDSHFYVQSRYYRAPEVILGLTYDINIDIWSLGCMVYELFVGYPLFPGKNNYDQIERIIRILGDPPISMIESCKNIHFYNERNLESKGPRIEEIKQKIMNQPCTLHENILFFKFLFQILQWNPLKRPTPFQLRKNEYLNFNFDKENVWNQAFASGITVDRNQPNPFPESKLRRESVYDLSTFSHRARKLSSGRKKSEYEIKKK